MKYVTIAAHCILTLIIIWIGYGFYTSSLVIASYTHNTRGLLMLALVFLTLMALLLNIFYRGKLTVTIVVLCLIWMIWLGYNLYAKLLIYHRTQQVCYVTPFDLTCK